MNETAICELTSSDIPEILSTFNFPWTTPDVQLKKWQEYYAEHEQKKRVVFIVQKNKKIIGYGTFVYQPNYRYFKDNGIPEISDLWILESERRKGYALKLIRHIEQFATSAGYRVIGLGVGLYKDYGSAQRLYVKSGYIPDGNGITYKNLSVIPGKAYPIDDDLILWMIKILKI